MKNNCDVSGEHTYCKTTKSRLGRVFSNCDFFEDDKKGWCIYMQRFGSCINTAAIRAAIEAERKCDGCAYDAMTPEKDESVCTHREKDCTRRGVDRYDAGEKGE